MKPVPATADAPFCPIPLYASKVSAGFPSPADDYIEGHLDLNERLVKNKTATFFLRVQGDSMKRAHVHDGDLLVVDRSLVPKHKSIVVAVINGDLTVKFLYKIGAVVKLVPGNEAFSEIVIGADTDMTIWGVVKHVIHSFD